MFDRKQTFSNFAWGFAAGIVTGAVAALLYAPMTGRKMQKKVGTAKDRVVSVVGDSVDNVQNVLRKVANA